MKTKTSYGIACCRKRKNDHFEIIMVKKRFTYSFFEFVYGNYSFKNLYYDLKKLFNGMTYDEKMTIATMNFDFIWIKIWLYVPISRDSDKKSLIKLSNIYSNIGLLYSNKKQIFTRLEKYRDVVSSALKNSTFMETIWEIPKGRSDIKEEKLTTAMREFHEETTIKDYRIAHDIPEFTETFVDCNVIYKNIYYTAIIDNTDYKPCLTFKEPHQYSEVQDIRWVKLTDIDILTTNLTIRNRQKSAMKYIFNNLKRLRKRKI